LVGFRRDSFVTHRAFCGALVEETGRVLAVPAPPSPRPPDLEAEENVDKDKEEEVKEKEKEKELEENEDSPVAEVDEPQPSQAVAEVPQQCAPSPPPPILQEHPQPVVAVVPNVDGMLLSHFCCLFVILPIDRLDEIYGKLELI
jgi:hypothetical protein